MVLTDENITDFQALYKSKFGVEITHEEANEKGMKLARLMSLVYNPMTQEEYDRVQKRRAEILPELYKQN